MAPRKLSGEFERIGSEMDRFVLNPESFTSTLLRPVPAEFIAPKKIVVGVDGSSESQRAVDWAVVLAKEYDAEVDLVTVVGSGAEFLMYKDKATSLERSEFAAGEAALAKATGRLLPAGFDPKRHLLRGDPAREIAQHARKNHAELIVVGDRGRGRIGRALLGRVAAKVRDIATCDVLIAKAVPPPTGILVAVDGSPESKKAVAVATRLADDWGVRASVLFVVQPPGFATVGAARFAYHRRFDPLNLPKLEDPELRFEVEFGRPADVILARAKRHACNLVLMGSRGLGKAERVLVGSVSARVSHESPANVWIVRTR